MAKCELCGEPMPEGEEVFKYHGYSGDCPKPPLQRPLQDKDAILAYTDHLEAHMDEGGTTGPNNVRDLIRIVRELCNGTIPTDAVDQQWRDLAEWTKRNRGY